MGIETITVTRPLKVIAFTCCFITVILMVAATSTADWMLAEGWREGLFMQCISAGADTPLPFKMDPDIGCRVARSASYLRGTAALVIIGLIFDFFGTFLTGLGLRSTDPNKKYKYYRVAIYSLGVAVVALFLAVIIYPTSMAKEMGEGDDRVWGFGFGFGSAVFSLIFLLLSLILLICDRESEEIFYKEREAEEEEGEEEKEEA